MTVVLVSRLSEVSLRLPAVSVAGLSELSELTRVIGTVLPVPWQYHGAEVSALRSTWPVREGHQSMRSMCVCVCVCVCACACVCVCVCVFLRTSTQHCWTQRHEQEFQKNGDKMVEETVVCLYYQFCQVIQKSAFNIPSIPPNQRKALCSIFSVTPQVKAGFVVRSPPKGHVFQTLNITARQTWSCFIFPVFPQSSSSSSSSAAASSLAFPALSLGFTIYDEIFCVYCHF